MQAYQEDLEADLLLIEENVERELTNMGDKVGVIGGFYSPINSCLSATGFASSSPSALTPCLPRPPAHGLRVGVRVNWLYPL